MTSQLNHRVYQKAFRVAGKVGTCRPEETVVLAGSPRSGTTLLLEVLQPLPGYKTLNEPLVKKPLRERHGFYHRTFLEPGQAAPRQRTFLARVLQGQAVPPIPCWLFRSRLKAGWLVEHALGHRLLVKFCRINRMLHWFDAQFDVREIVLIVRHPCAVINSMINHPQWNNDLVQMKHRKDSVLYIGHLPTSVQQVFRPIIDRISTQTEALATVWCLDHYLPLFAYNYHPWMLVAYERLVKRGPEELERIADGLGMQVNNDMLARLHKPSSSTVDGVKTDIAAQLEKWRDKLSRKQIDDILRIVDESGLSCIYSRAAEPDYSVLNRFQDARYRWPAPSHAAEAAGRDDRRAVPNPLQ